MIHEKGLFVGFDVGSALLHVAVLSSDKQIVYCPAPTMHFANPIGVLSDAWVDIVGRFGRGSIRSTSFTGSGAEAFAEVMKGVCFAYESLAIPKGAGLIAPAGQFIFHIGAKDAYFFSVADVGSRRIIREWKTGTKCGGGSGTLIEKQCRRLFEGEVPHPTLEDPASATDEPERQRVRLANRAKLQARLEDMFRQSEQEAGKSAEPSEFLARCGVVIQSDLIHKQNEGATRPDSLAGLFRTVARNYKIDVLGSREFSEARGQGCAIATGGVFANDLIRANLEKALSIQISRPEHFENVTAIGAALRAIEQGDRFVLSAADLGRIAEFSRQKRQYAPALALSLDKVDDYRQELAGEIAPGTEVVLGIDGGSTTTKGALVELSTGRLLDKLYVKTHGNPEASLKCVLKYLARHKDKIVVRGVGATGSARRLYERLLISKKKTQELTDGCVEPVDRITDEITCHALGVRHYDPQVDTIFEVGGQDMKFTAFAKDGTVKEAKMNYSCQAGSGQTLENMADVINLNVQDSLQEAALRAERVPIIDSTCGVFMEMDENRLIAEGFSRDEIAAAIVRGTAASYFWKFVGGSAHVGQKCSAQGGPPLGKAFLAALAQVTGKQIEAYPHREMFGAWGQALDIIEHIRLAEQQGKCCGSAFRGWQIVDMSFTKRKVSCKELFGAGSCGVRDCQLDVFSIEDDQIVTGGFCPRGNSESSRKAKTNYVDKYHRIYEKHFKRFGALLEDVSLGKVDVSGRTTVGIKRSTATLEEKGIWSAALFTKLGFFPVVSPCSNKEIAKVGVDLSRTEFCYARKLVTGHAALLKAEPKIQYLFNPSFIEQRMDAPPDLKYCIYTESEGYILNDVLSLDKNRQINPILHFGDEELVVQALRREFDRLGFRFSERQIRQAMQAADDAERKFKQELYAEGDKFLQRIEARQGWGERAYVGVGRDYVLLDPEASSNSGAMFSQIRGLEYIPQVFLEHKFMDMSLDGIVTNEFWVQSVKILRAHLYVAGHPNLYAIRMMNFACGPDSLKIYQEERIQQSVNKPMLVLLTDAQTNNAPFVTRTEAHERVVNQCRPVPLDSSRLIRRPEADVAKRTWLIPYMGDASYAAAAGLRNIGVNGMVLPTNTARGYEVARKHIYTEVCHPLKGVVGDAIGFLHEQIEKHGREFVEQNYLVMLPTTSGPCRFGKYVELLRMFMDDEGLAKVPVVGPSSETDYFDIPMPRKMGFFEKMKMQMILYKGVRAADMLEDITLRHRPYAQDKQAIERLKTERRLALENVLAHGAKTAALIDWGRQTVAAFRQSVHGAARYPLVLYIGEIYMRQHDPYTGYVVRQLEDYRLEVVRDPVTDWLHYVNKMNVRNTKRDLRLALRRGRVGKSLHLAAKLGQCLFKGWYMSAADRRLGEPFHEVLASRHVLPEPIEIIETLEKAGETHGSIEGESPLSTGIAYYMMHDLIPPAVSLSKPHQSMDGDAKVSGIFHVGPFTCMQEGVATAKIEAMAKELRKTKPELVFPIVHAFFGDSGSANLDSEIAVFAEQCYQKREMTVAGAR